MTMLEVKAGCSSDRAGLQYPIARPSMDRTGEWRGLLSGPITGPARALFILALGFIMPQSPAWGQEPSAPPEAASESDRQALSVRYRFRELYASKEDPEHPELLTQYQVAVRDSVKMMREKSQGTPDRIESTLQTIVTERATRVQKGVVSDVVRRYDTARIKSSTPFRQSRTPWLEGLSVWYHVRPGQRPEIFSLVEGRGMREEEFELILKHVFLPQVSLLLPASPKRVGDQWPTARQAIQGLIGEIPVEGDENVTAELIEVRKNAGDSGMTAVIGVKGEFAIAEGPTAINARIHFDFRPRRIDDQKPAPAAATETPAAPATNPTPAQSNTDKDGAIVGLGYISKVRLAQVITLPPPDGEDGRLSQTLSREIVLDRRVPEPSQGQTAPLAVPDIPPVSNSESSWLTYDDARGRYHLKHPQALRVARVEEDELGLVDLSPNGRDVVVIVFQAKGTRFDPLQKKRSMTDHWKKRGQEVLMGPAEWLPDADWRPLNRRVYRIEAAIKPSRTAEPAVRSGRIYLDDYSVQFGREQSLNVEAMTGRDPHLEFRNDAEKIIKSFNFGPSESPGAAKPGTSPGGAPG